MCLCYVVIFGMPYLTVFFFSFIVVYFVFVFFVVFFFKQKTAYEITV